MFVFAKKQRMCTSVTHVVEALHDVVWRASQFVGDRLLLRRIQCEILQNIIEQIVMYFSFLEKNKAR